MMFCPWLKPTWLPTTVVVPLELILNARIPVVLWVVGVSHAGSALMIAYANVPAGSTTTDVGIPFRTQTLFDVSAGVLSTADACPLDRLKLNVSMSPEP